MKKLLVILFLLLAFPALANDAQLPKKFLGWWSPFSATTAGIGIDIQPDGRMIVIHEESKKNFGTNHYSYLFSPSENEAYVLLYAYHSLQNPKIWKLKKELDSASLPQNYVLERMILPCEISNFKKDMLSRDYLVQFIKEGKCMPPYSGSMGPSTDYYARTETGK